MPITKPFANARARPSPSCGVLRRAVRPAAASAPAVVSHRHRWWEPVALHGVATTEAVPCGRSVLEPQWGSATGRLGARPALPGRSAQAGCPSCGGQRTFGGGPPPPVAGTRGTERCCASASRRVRLQVLVQPLCSPTSRPSMAGLPNPMFESDSPGVARCSALPNSVPPGLPLNKTLALAPTHRPDEGIH